MLLAPYLLIGVMGGGITLQQITDGAAPPWLGSLLICGVVIGYVTSGGLRGTAWVNTFQTGMFMLLGAVTAILIVTKLGGVGAALDRVAATRPELLIRGDAIHPLRLLSYTLIPLSVGTFPHIFSHWLSARQAATFKAPIVLYPVCIAVVWIPSVLLGVFGNIDFPGLEGPASNSVLIRLIALYTPDLLAGLLGAGVFAAIMSSLDSQSLSLGTMFTQDIVRHYRWGGELSESRQILLGRLFVEGVVAAVFLVSPGCRAEHLRAVGVVLHGLCLPVARRHSGPLLAAQHGRGSGRRDRHRDRLLDLVLRSRVRSAGLQRGRHGRDAGGRHLRRLGRGAGRRFPAQ